MPRGLKHRFYGDSEIMIAWSRFNSHPHRTCCCILGKGALRWLSLFGSFEQAANSVGKSQKNNQNPRKWITPKWVRIHPKYHATVAFLRQEVNCKNAIPVYYT